MTRKDDPVAKYFDPSDWLALVEERARKPTVGKHPRFDANGKPLTKNGWVTRRERAEAAMTPEQREERERKRRSAAMRKHWLTKRAEMMGAAEDRYRGKLLRRRREKVPRRNRVLVAMVPGESYPAVSLAKALGEVGSAFVNSALSELLGKELVTRRKVPNPDHATEGSWLHPTVYAYSLTDEGTKVRAAILQAAG